MSCENSSFSLGKLFRYFEVNVSKIHRKIILEFLSERLIACKQAIVEKSPKVPNFLQ